MVLPDLLFCDKHGLRGGCGKLEASAPGGEPVQCAMGCVNGKVFDDPEDGTVSQAQLDWVGQCKSGMGQMDPHKCGPVWQDSFDALRKFAVTARERGVEYSACIPGEVGAADPEWAPAAHVRPMLSVVCVYGSGSGSNFSEQWAKCTPSVEMNYDGPGYGVIFKCSNL